MGRSKNGLNIQPFYNAAETGRSKRERDPPVAEPGDGRPRRVPVRERRTVHGEGGADRLPDLRAPAQHPERVRPPLDRDAEAEGGRPGRSGDGRGLGHQGEPGGEPATGLLTATQIAEIQTKGRDVANLLRLLPGVRYADDVEALGESFGTELPNVGGQHKHRNHVSIDGVTGNEIGRSNHVGQQVNHHAALPYAYMIYFGP